MKRPVGYVVIAVLLALSSVAGLSSVFWAPLELFGGAATIWDRLIPLAVAAAGLHAAWMLWRYERRAPEAYLLWAALMVGNTLYTAFVLLPRISQALARRAGTVLPDFPVGLRLYQAAFITLVVALGYWYLASHRRGRQGDATPEAPPR